MRAGMDGGLADPEPGGDLRRSGVFGQVHQCHHRALGRSEPASPVALSRVVISMVTHSTSACGRSGAAGWMTNEAPEQRD